MTGSTPLLSSFDFKIFCGREKILSQEYDLESLVNYI